MGLANFSLRLTADKPPMVTVNGQRLDVPGLVGIAVRHEPPSLPQLVLELTGELVIEGEGVVAVDSGAHGDEIAFMRQCLGNLDPDRLDDAACRLFGTEGPNGQVVTKPGEAFVAAILGMIPA